VPLPLANLALRRGALAVGRGDSGFCRHSSGRRNPKPSRIAPKAPDFRIHENDETSDGRESLSTLNGHSPPESTSGIIAK